MIRKHPPGPGGIFIIGVPEFCNLGNNLFGVQSFQHQTAFCFFHQIGQGYGTADQNGPAGGQAFQKRVGVSLDQGGTVG